MSHLAHAAEAQSDDRVLTVDDVLKLLQVSRSWLYSAAGRASVGQGFMLGGSRRYRRSAVLAALSRAEAAQ